MSLFGKMDNVLFLFLGFLAFTLCTILIALCVKNIKPKVTKTDISKQIANTLEHENSGVKINEYTQYFEEDDEYSYKGWR